MCRDQQYPGNYGDRAEGQGRQDGEALKKDRRWSGSSVSIRAETAIRGMDKPRRVHQAMTQTAGIHFVYFSINSSHLIVHLKIQYTVN